MGINQTTKDRALEKNLKERGLFSSTSAPWQQKILADFLKDIDTNNYQSCLDAACGIGNNLSTLTNEIDEVHAFDMSKKAIEFARERYNEENIIFSVGKLESIKYEDNSFDLVICTEALEHVENYDNAINELHRALKPGGYLILSFQNHFNFSAIIKFIYEKLLKKNWDVWGTHRHAEGFESYLTTFDVRKEIKEKGFTIIKDQGADYINAYLSWMPYFYLNYKILNKYPLLFLGKLPLIKYLGMDYFILLRK